MWTTISHTLQIGLLVFILIFVRFDSVARDENEKNRFEGLANHLTQVVIGRFDTLEARSNEIRQTVAAGIRSADLAPLSSDIEKVKNDQTGVNQSMRSLNAATNTNYQLLLDLSKQIARSQNAAGWIYEAVCRIGPTTSRPQPLVVTADVATTDSDTDLELDDKGGTCTVDLNGVYRFRYSAEGAVTVDTNPQKSGVGIETIGSIISVKFDPGRPRNGLTVRRIEQLGY